MRIGFDNEKYISMQSKKILERIGRFGDKLYLEFGGKLFDDYHASRVVPGFLPDTKINMLSELSDSAEIILAIYSGDIERNKVRSDNDVAYDREVLRLIDAFRGRGLYVSGVVITRYDDQPAVNSFKDRLERLGVKVYRHYPIEGYPKNPKFIVSDEGFGRNDYIETTRPLVVVTAPGPGSGKLAVCLSQVYQEFRRGVRAGYAKFETFPVWNLPLSHPVNLAYEAATIDLDDMNMIDPFHLEAYGVTTVNYNRDVESFPVLNTIFTHIYGESPYKSPTDMGVNMIGNCITDDEAVCAAARQEIIRRYYQAACAFKRGRAEKEQVYKAEFIMSRAGISVDDRPVVAAALARAEETGSPAMALELPDGKMITGKTGEFVGPAAGAIVNALKALAGINSNIDLISPIILDPIRKLKINNFGSENPLLHSDEVLYALSICAATNPTADLAIRQLPKLRGCEAHSSVMLTRADQSVYRKLGINCTSEPIRSGNRLYM
jgi:uncharacterized protein (UPF0371 family)